MEDDEKACPRCAETIKAAALVCKHCHHEFTAAPPQPAPLKIAVAKKAINKRGCLIAFLIFAAVAIGIGTFGPRQSSPGPTVPANSQGQQAIINKRTPVSVEMSVAVASANPLTITGTTNLPEGTALSGELKGDMPKCLPRCGLEFRPMAVRNGHFTGQIASAEQLVPDTYTVDIVTTAAVTQPKNVRLIIGESGENLIGPYVVTLENGGQYLPANPSPGHTPSAGEAMLGLMVHFTQRIQLTADGAASTVPCAGSRNSAEADCGLLKASEPPRQMEPESESAPIAQARATNSARDSVVRYTNPADTEFCGRPSTLQAMNATAAQMVEGGFHVRNVEAGENFCESNLPGQCRAEPTPGKHVCHAVVQPEGGKAVPGTFDVDETGPLGTTAAFRSDAQLRADGILTSQGSNAPALAGWSGHWVSGDYNIKIAIVGSGLAASGDGMAGSNTGNFAASAIPVGNEVTFSDDACKVSMQLDGPSLIVKDDKDCGGMNVSFHGTYHRR